MPSRATSRHARALGQAVFAIVLIFASDTYAQRSAEASAGPFAGLSGSWSGGGTVTLANGTSERIRCRASYAVGGGGNNLQQQLRCASDSYTFQLHGNVAHSGGQISGTWSEATRNIGGNVSGRASAGHVQAIILGPAFAANLSVTTRGDRQSVSIRSEGTEVANVSISLSRGSR
jgi:hypothetical protein